MRSAPSAIRITRGFSPPSSGSTASQGLLMESEAARDDDIIERFAACGSKSKRAKANGLADDADHYTLATAVIDSITARTGHKPIGALGQLWRVHDGLWLGSNLDALAVE